jgi:hypothetical protein
VVYYVIKLFENIHSTVHRRPRQYLRDWGQVGHLPHLLNKHEFLELWSAVDGAPVFFYNIFHPGLGVFYTFSQIVDHVPKGIPTVTGHDVLPQTIFDRVAHFQPHVSARLFFQQLLFPFPQEPFHVRLGTLALEKGVSERPVFFVLFLLGYRVVVGNDDVAQMVEGPYGLEEKAVVFILFFALGGKTRALLDGPEEVVPRNVHFRVWNVVVDSMVALFKEPFKIMGIVHGVRHRLDL